MATIRAITESAASRSTRTRSAPVPLRVPANTSSPGCLRDRQRFAGDGGLVDLAGAVEDPAVGADPLAGTDQDDVTDREFGGGDRLLAAVGGQPGGGGGREVEQAAHRVGGAGGGQRLQRAGGGEDDDQQGAVHHLPDRGRADRGDDHQQVDVQGLVPQRLQPCPGRLPAAGDVGDRVQRAPRPGRARRSAGAAARSGKRPAAAAAQRASGSAKTRVRRRGAVRGAAGAAGRGGWSRTEGMTERPFRAEDGDTPTIQEHMKSSSCVLYAVGWRPWVTEPTPPHRTPPPRERLDAASAAECRRHPPGPGHPLAAADPRPPARRPLRGRRARPAVGMEAVRLLPPAAAAAQPRPGHRRAERTLDRLRPVRPPRRRTPRPGALPRRTPAARAQ